MSEQTKVSDKNKNWQDYLDLLTKIGVVLDDLTQLQQNKTKAVVQGQVTLVDEIMKKEQAHALALRGFEQKRGKALELLGIPPCPLNQLMNHVPRSVHFKAKKVVEDVQTKYALFQAASEVARNTLEMNLHQIEVITGQTESIHKQVLEQEQGKEKQHPLQGKANFVV